MQKRTSDVQIQLARVREKLPVRRDPYWRMLQTRGYLGFRKTKTGAGTWIARWRDESGKAHFQSLGRVEDLTYSDAAQAALAWFLQSEGGVIASDTVRAVCEAYLAEMKTTKGDNRDAAQRLGKHVLDNPIADKRIDKLRPADLQKWRDDLAATGVSASTVNRNLRALRAALQFGYRSGLCSSDRAWKTVKTLPAQQGARTQYLDIDQRRKLLEHADADLGSFIRLALMTGARPGELRACTVADFDQLTRTLTLRTRKGNRERERAFPLSGDALVLVQQLAAHRAPQEPLLTYRGRAWSKDQLAKSFREARDAAGLPGDVVVYTCRHCAAVDSLLAGIDPMTLAKLLGTSIQMIDQHYHKYLRTSVSACLESIPRF